MRASSVCVGIAPEGIVEVCQAMFGQILSGAQGDFFVFGPDDRWFSLYLPDRRNLDVGKLADLVVSQKQGKPIGVCLRERSIVVGAVMVSREGKGGIETFFPEGTPPEKARPLEVFLREFMVKLYLRYSENN